LAIGELLYNSGNFMADKYDKVANMILIKCALQKSFLRGVALTILPYLSKYSPELFCGKENYLDKSMKHIFAIFRERKSPDRAQAFLAVGEIPKSITKPEIFMNHLGTMIEIIINTLSKVKKGTRQEAIICVGMLAESIRDKMQTHLEKLLPLMFGTGLSQYLVDALKAIVEHVPKFSAVVQVDLLDLLSKVLNPKFDRIANRPQEIDNNLILIALNTLGSFKFEKWRLKKLTECVLRYLYSDSKQIRKAAVATACHLITPDKSVTISSNGNAAKISKVLSRLLRVLITDTDFQIRKAVLDQIGNRFDSYLIDSDNIQCLFTALADEQFEIRELAIISLGRLTSRNPALIIPFFRKKLIQLLYELKLETTEPIAQEHCSCLLAHLLGNSASMPQPYVSEILEVLLRTIKLPDTRVATYSLRALGQLSKVGWRTLENHVETLLPRIFEPLQDQSSSAKRLEALRTLGNIVKWTGFVITPFTTYPRLLPLLLGIIKTEQLQEIRTEAAKVIGILGAIDPYRHRQNQLRQKK